MLKHILLEMQVKTQATCVTSFNSNTSSNRLMKILRWNTMKISKEIVYPKDRKNLIWFLDDLHNVLSDKTDSTEFLRHFIEHRAWIDNKCPQRLQQTQIIAAMRNSYPLHTFPSSTIRLLNKFHTISYNSCSDESNATIFRNKMMAAIKAIAPNKFIDVLVPATIDFVRSLAIQLPATPIKPRYQFSLKTVDRILHSMCIFCPNICHYEKNPLLRLWIHECFRETWDLLDNVDYKLYYEIFNDTISKHFEATLHSICPGNKSPLFCDVLNQEGSYEDVKETNQLMQFAEKATNSNADSKTIVYQEAVEHAAKLLRISRIRKGHMVLVGEIGSGRHTICDLATSILNHQTVSKSSQTAMDQRETIYHQLRFTNDDSEDVVDKKVGHLFDLAATNRVICLVLADDTANLNHYFLEFLNGFVVNDSISGFLSQKVFEDVNVLAAIKNNLHFVLCLPMNTKPYRYLLNTYTSLLTSTTTNCIHSLTEMSLMEVAKLFFKMHIIFDVPVSCQETLKVDTEPTVRQIII
ncbi:dynein heavy chain 2, axonemal-like [Culex quinquefasciatus]|uniref:dynein heavy chain 2, axonemal-like n=1 Tax=Culex quinquefasciatus TaxID=7176 RepID=UPI0018E35C4A|nr:dynein heavy chain 2, axonemal-like [Culex quinquefasciatus]